VAEIPFILARLFFTRHNSVLLIHRKPVLKVGQFVLIGIWKVLVWGKSAVSYNQVRESGTAKTASAVSVRHSDKFKHQMKHKTKIKVLFLLSTSTAQTTAC
jgi:hypothetical protein